MSKINNIVRITYISILFILFVVPVFLSLQLNMIPAHEQPGYGEQGRVSVYGGRKFVQKFISSDINLVAIATTVKNPNLGNKKEVYFHLYNKDGSLLRTVILNGFNIGDGDFVKFVFEPITDSKGKEYSFSISSPDAIPEEMLELFITSKNDYILDYIYDEDVRSGGIPMVTFHKPDNRFEVVKQIYFNLFSKLLHLDFDK